MLRLARTALPRAQVSTRHGVRYASSTLSRPAGRRIALASGGIALGLATLLSSKIYADSAAVVSLPSKPKEDEATRSSFGTLVRTYVVYTMCSIPALVDSAPWLLDTFTSIPGLRWITETLVRVTFFDQFVGGDSAAERCRFSLPPVRDIGALFAYSVEVDEAEAMAASGSGSSQKSPIRHRARDDTLHRRAADFEDSIDAKQTGRRTWVAVKITALLPDASALIRLSSHIIATRPPTSSPHVVFPGTPTSADLDLHANLEAICTRAAARGVRIITAAQPLVYATFQAYLRRTPAHLAHALRDAQTHRYALGVKLVRGAYRSHEAAAHGVPHSLSISREERAPVWDVKADTDAAYDACAGLLLDAVAVDPVHMGLLFGTHNWASCKAVLEGMERRGLAMRTAGGKLRVGERVGERVTFGQLYGMCDDLTQHLAAQTEAAAPMVIKYVPYGALSEVRLPFSSFPFSFLPNLDFANLT
ncbi:FAD-linked oxidoreductase-like protein [Mycena rosella]|uniref:Proline dehydrogenase n=1 Tax=Mycena rosella TaxID=1033263 RepID=A0AAD7GAN6_MYCRO|nr:FAD-linked oxidoreductase-like protein [Mycena rosella]